MSDIKEFLKTKEKPKQFIAIHNTDPDKLAKLFELNFDAIPAPSIQIKPFPDKDYNLHTISKDDSLHSYGSISFIFDKSNVFGKHTTIPKNDNTHKIYAGDGYTIRFPDKQYSVQRKPYNRLIDRLIDLTHHDKSCFNDSIIQYLEKTYKNKDDIQERMNRSFLMKLMFLEDNNMLDDFKISKNRKNVSSFIRGNKDIYKILGNFSASYIKENLSLITGAFQKIIDETKDPIERESLNDLYKDDGIITTATIIELHRDDIKIIKGKNKFINVEKTSKNLNSLIKKLEKQKEKSLEDFVISKLSPVFNNPKIKGTSTLYTSENVLNWMKRNNSAGNEQSLYTDYNAVGAENQIIIRHDSDFDYHVEKIVSHQERMDYNKQRFDLEQIIEEKLMSNHYHGDYTKHEDKKELIVFAIGSMGRNPDKETVVNCLNRYKFDIKDNLSLTSEVQKFAILNNNVIHEYYEAKPMKDFSFNSSNIGNNHAIKGVVVPNNLNEKIMANLEKHNIKIVKYNPKNPESRMRALYKFREHFIKPELEQPILQKVKKQRIK
jgi:hypothetical protein